MYVLIGILFFVPFTVAVVVTNDNMGVSVAVGVAGVILGCLAIVLYADRRQRRRDLEYLRSGMADVDQMPGVEFEKYVAARLRQAGWAVSTTSATGDYGVDLIAKKDGRCVAVQCKRYGKAVGVSAVQQVVAGAAHHRCTSTMLVSNQDFTKAARQLAQTHRCRLIGREQLPRWTP